MTCYNTNYFARFRPLKNGSFPDNPRLAFRLTNTVGWRHETVEDPVLGYLCLCLLPGSRFKLWYTPAPLRQHPCLVVCRMQRFQDETTLCGRKSESAEKYFSVMFKALIPFLLHFMSDAEGIKYHPFKNTILYFRCYDIKKWSYDVLPLQIVYKIILLNLCSFLKSI